MYMYILIVSAINIAVHKMQLNLNLQLNYVSHKGNTIAHAS